MSASESAFVKSFKMTEISYTRINSGGGFIQLHLMKPKFIKFSWFPGTMRTMSRSYP